MKIVTDFIYLCFGASIILATIYGREITTQTQEWWNNNYDNFYLKFNSPSGNTFYIDHFDGSIYQENNEAEYFEQSEMVVSETVVPLNEVKKLPFITFVSVYLKIYDIYFECDDHIKCTPRLEESQFVYKRKYSLIRHRLDSFVGPNKKVFQVIYNDSNELNIKEKSPEDVHFQIKTFGPYEKWEHTYDFSENGDLVLDHTISPIPVFPQRSILVPKLEPSSFIKKDYIHTFVKYNSPSGTNYHITNQLNIVPIPDDDVKDEFYITFIEPNGRTYDILIDKEDGRPILVDKGLNENYFVERLYSFVSPNRILYRVDHKNEDDNEVPILVSSSSDSTELQITLLRPQRTYNVLVKYIFSANGMKLFDRLDEFDWTPLNQLPALPVEEVTASYAMDNLPFLTLFTPSGNNYHIFTKEKEANIVVEKGANSSQPLYISYYQFNGRKANIYFVPGDRPYLEQDAGLVANKNFFSFWLKSFGTPDQNEYTINRKHYENELEEYIELPFRAREPIDLIPVDALSITVLKKYGDGYVWSFTWNGDKLIETLSPSDDFIPGGNYVSFPGSGLQNFPMGMMRKISRYLKNAFF